MLFGDAVNVFLGLALTFAVVAGLASAVCEGIASLLKLRANTLLSGLGTILNDKDLSGLGAAILNHAAINPRGPGSDPQQAASYSIRPSYIPSRQFASAFLDVIQQRDNNPLDLQTAINNVADPQLKVLLQGFYDRAKGDVETVRQEVGDWFDAAMDRLSGAYKRQTQAITFVVSLVLAALLNVDAFEVARALWAHPAASAMALKQITADMPAKEALNLLAADFPLGWSEKAKWNNFWQYIDASNVLGWLATAFASLFGAPFWFDLIQRVARLKGAGAGPSKP